MVQPPFFQVRFNKTVPLSNSHNPCFFTDYLQSGSSINFFSIKKIKSQVIFYTPLQNNLMHPLSNCVRTPTRVRGCVNFNSLELLVCTVLTKSSSLPVICLRNRGSLKVFNDFKFILKFQETTRTHSESMWNHSKPSDVPWS
jgi:hypothetical protein